MLLVAKQGKTCLTVIGFTIVVLGSWPGGGRLSCCCGQELVVATVVGSPVDGLRAPDGDHSSSRRIQPTTTRSYVKVGNGCFDSAEPEPASAIVPLDGVPGGEASFLTRMEMIEGQQELDTWRSDVEGDVDAAAVTLAERRNDFRAALQRPLSMTPVQQAVTYVDDEGRPLPWIRGQKDYLLTFAGYDNSPLYLGGTRADRDGFPWYPMSAVWKSPDICYGPLYFEESNLERFGARFPVLQPGISAAHFFSSTVWLPYSMGRQPACDCYYSAGYGRPGNSYCYRARRPVWSLKGATFQSLLVTGLVFALP